MLWQFSQSVAKAYCCGHCQVHCQKGCEKFDSWRFIGQCANVLSLLVSVLVENAIAAYQLAVLIMLLLGVMCSNENMDCLNQFDYPLPRQLRGSHSLSTRCYLHFGQVSLAVLFYAMAVSLFLPSEGCESRQLVAMASVHVARFNYSICNLLYSPKL